MINFLFTAAVIFCFQFVFCAGDEKSILSQVPSYKSRFIGTQTNYGKHFFIGFTSRYENRKKYDVTVFIAALDETNVTIYSEQTGFPRNATAHVPKEGVFQWKLPASWRMRELTLRQKGIEIWSSADISVLCLNFDSDFTVEANLALPTLPDPPGSVYYVSSYLPFCMNCSTNIAIISANNNNTVMLAFNRNVSFFDGDRKFHGNIGLLSVPFEKRDAVYVSSKIDLSGTVVRAKKTVTVISGVDDAEMLGSYSFLEATLLPIHLWGYEYILTTVGEEKKAHGDFFRIFASRNNTVVECSYWTKVLSAGTNVELMLQKDLASYIKCNKPCQVVQYIRRESVYLGNKRLSSMMTLPSVNQFLSFYHVALPGSSQFSYSITIVIKKENIDGLYGDGLKLSGLQWKGVNRTKYVWTVINLPQLRKVTVYHISSSVKFGLLVLGWNDKSSHSYPGGYGFDYQPHRPQPSKPRNVTVTVNRSTMIVRWLPAEVFDGVADHYLVSWRRNESDTFAKKQVADSPFIHDFGNDSGIYTIAVQAVSADGIQSEIAYLHNVEIGRNYAIYITTQSIKPTIHHENASAHTYIVTTRMNPIAISIPSIAGGSAGGFAFLCLAVVIFLLRLRKMRRKRRAESIQEFATNWLAINSKKTNMAIEQPNRIYDSRPQRISYVALLKGWQISPNQLKVLNKPLGSGQFGIVKKGLYTPSSGSGPEDVAVKMLKDNATQSALSNLLAELKILKMINKEPHPNVIKFIGGIFTEEKLMVVTEYCSSGNLQTFLRKSKVIDISDTSQPQTLKINSTLSYHQLLKIAVEVSSGMLYLSSKKFIHRDLAARNILLGGEDNVAKISDFGLARDIRNTEVYIRTNQDLLPVKWMAFESLVDGRFTTASDVWSFGVLLYEIVTLGQEPYKGVSPYDIKFHVVSGRRMEKPPHCSSEMYGIMLNCWKADAEARPNFTEIQQNLYHLTNDDEKSYFNVEQVMVKSSVQKC